MDVLERIRRGYRAIGSPGAPREVLAMFHQERLDPPQWVIENGGHLMATREVVAMDLFAGGLPSQWEVIGVELRRWDLYRKKGRLVVSGRFRARLRGTWEVLPQPFVHVWTFDDEVRAVFDYFGGVEVLRIEDVRRGGGWTWLRRVWALLRGHPQPDPACSRAG